MPEDCWYYAGYIGDNGYGRITISHRSYYVHRLMYKDFKGEIPTDFVLDHLCRVRHCINPNHLEATTRNENIMRGEGACAKNARKTHCGKGHEYSAENTYRVPGKGWRFCLECFSVRGGVPCKL